MTITVEPVPSVGDVLERALEGERISEEDAIALLHSRDLVEVGRVANEIRSRMTDPSKVTFIVDRDRKSTRLNSSHLTQSRMPSSA